MPSRRMSEPRGEPSLGRGYWAAYFDAIATGELLLKPHTARRRAGEVARNCPYEDVAAAGLAKVKAAIKAQAIMAAPQPIRAGTLPRVEA
jgi:hypothetical protein